MNNQIIASSVIVRALSEMAEPLLAELVEGPRVSANSLTAEVVLGCLWGLDEDYLVDRVCNFGVSDDEAVAFVMRVYGTVGLYGAAEVVRALVGYSHQLGGVAQIACLLWERFEDKHGPCPVGLAILDVDGAGEFVVSRLSAVEIADLEVVALRRRESRGALASLNTYRDSLRSVLRVKRSEAFSVEASRSSGAAFQELSGILSPLEAEFAGGDFEMSVGGAHLALAALWDKSADDVLREWDFGWLAANTCSDDPYASVQEAVYVARRLPVLESVWGDLTDLVARLGAEVFASELVEGPLLPESVAFEFCWGWSGAEAAYGPHPAGFTLVDGAGGRVVVSS